MTVERTIEQEVIKNYLDNQEITEEWVGKVFGFVSSQEGVLTKEEKLEIDKILSEVRGKVNTWKHFEEKIKAFNPGVKNVRHYVNNEEEETAETRIKKIIDNSQAGKKDKKILKAIVLKMLENTIEGNCNLEISLEMLINFVRTTDFLILDSQTQHEVIEISKEWNERNRKHHLERRQKALQLIKKLSVLNLVGNWGLARAEDLREEVEEKSELLQEKNKKFEEKELENERLKAELEEVKEILRAKSERLIEIEGENEQLKSELGEKSDENAELRTIINQKPQEKRNKIFSLKQNKLKLLGNKAKVKFQQLMAKVEVSTK